MAKNMWSILVNVLTGNPELIEETFKKIVSNLENNVPLEKLIKNLVTNYNQALVPMIRCIGSPTNDVNGFVKYVSEEVKSSLIINPMEYQAIKDCYVDTFANILTDAEKMDFIVKWAQIESQKTFGKGNLKHILEFVKSKEVVPLYRMPPSYEPPQYYELYLTDYKKRQSGGKKGGGKRGKKHGKISRSRKRRSKRTRKRSRRTTQRHRRKRFLK